jgi:hypothetical protein
MLRVKIYVQLTFLGKSLQPPLAIQLALAGSVSEVGGEYTIRIQECT